MLRCIMPALRPRTPSGFRLRPRVATLSIKSPKEALAWYKGELERLDQENLAKRKFVPPILTTKFGRELLKEPLLNKGTGFKTAERDSLRLRGLVPPRRLRMHQQCEKVMKNIRAEPDPLQQNIFLTALMDRNEVLYYRVLQDNIEELAPIVYTPTVGEVCQKFGSNFQQTRGMYFSGLDRGHMSSMMYNWPEDDVQVASIYRHTGRGLAGCISSSSILIPSSSHPHPIRIPSSSSSHPHPHPILIPSTPHPHLIPCTIHSPSRI